MRATAVQISVELCGEVRVEVDGRRCERALPGRLGRILLGYLALNRTRAITRDELIEALWPGGAPDDPGGTLSTLLSGLRRAVGPELVRGRAELRLALPAGARLDVEQAAAELERARATREPHAAMVLALSALEVLERTLLPGFDAPWLLQRRREHEEERLAALELLGRAALAAGAPHRAHAAAARLVAAAPYRESGYALLMECQEAEGNVAEALQTFERLRTVMRDELGTAPSAELRAVHQRLLTPAGAFPEPLARAARRRFVGRARALATLRGRLGGRSFVLLAGEPGIGKTSLAAAFAREVHDRGEAVVLYGRSDEDALAPYQPFAEMLGEDLAGLVEGGERYRLFEAVAETLARLGPLVLVCDDLQWADRPTLLLLRHLARARRPERLLVVATYRDTELAADAPLRELIADLRREHVLEEVALTGLDEAEAASLLDGLPAEKARRLHALTNGNPLFLEELVRAGDEAVPAGIKEVVRQRIARLPQPAHALLTLAAVAGQTFRPALLERHAAAGAVADVCDRALAAGLLTETGEPDVLAFAHALMRQTLYEELSDPRRVRLHLQVGETLEADRAALRPDPAELAHHFFRARHVGGPEPAIRHARAAARRAAESLAWEDEALQLERALEADELREPPDPADRAELLLALGEARTRGGHGAARAAFAEAAGLARGRDAGQLARAAIGYGGRYYEAGIVDVELIGLLREALDALPADGRELRPCLLARLAEILHFAGDTAAALELSEAALAGARALGDDDVLAAALAGRHVALLHVEHVDERLAVGRELLALADRAGDPQREMQALQARIFDRLSSGDVRGARQDRERLEALALALREPLFIHFAVGWAGTFAQLDGRLEEAERLARESYELRRQLQTRDAESVLAGQLFMIRRAQGRLAELVDVVADAVARQPELAAWRAALPLVHAAAGDERAARRELDRCLAGPLPRDFFWLGAVTMLGEAAARLGAAAPAERLYAALRPYASRWLQVGYAAPDGPVDRTLGLLAAAAGERAAAAVHLEAAVAACEAAGAPAFADRARADLAAL